MVTHSIAEPPAERFVHLTPYGADPDVENFIDLYCGGGGSGSGIINAFDRMRRSAQGTFFNHWERAIQTHELNHPRHDHHKEDLFLLDPTRLISPDIPITLLWASPQCTHFSIARGAAPVCEQQRSHADVVSDKWLPHLRPLVMLVENVKEFLTWGPVIQKRDKNGDLVWALKNKVMKVLPVEHRRFAGETEEGWERRIIAFGYDRYMVPDPARKGEFFRAWVKKIQEQGYLVDWRVLKSADYGDPTIRVRLFVQCVRICSGKRIVWPNPTHAKPKQDKVTGLYSVPAGLERWRTARDIIQWDIKGDSIFTRKKKLVPATMKRLAIGLVKHAFKEFLVPGNKGFGDGVRSPDIPAQVITTNARGEGVAQPDLQPFVVPNFGERDGQEPRTQSVENPAATVTSHGAGGLVQPDGFVLPKLGRIRTGNPLASADQPAPAVLTDGRIHVVQSELQAITGEFVLPSNKGWQEGGAIRDADLPTCAITVASRAEGVVAAHLQPIEGDFVLPKDQGHLQDYVRSTDEPASAAQTTAADSLVVAKLEPIIDVAHSKSTPQGADSPVDALSTHAKHGVVQTDAYVVQNSGQSTAMSVNAPLGAVHGDQKQYVAEPVIIHRRGTPGESKVASSVDDPTNALTATGTHEVLAEAFLKAIDDSFVVTTDNVGKDSKNDSTRSTDEPVTTIPTKANQAVARIEIKKLEECIRECTPEGVDASRVIALLEPLMEELRKVGRADIKPWVYVYYGSGAVGQDIDDPVPTARCRENLGVAYPVLEIDGDFLLLDIFYRMFTVLELQRAQGFPDDYKFAGTKSDMVKAIGNSVSCGVAEALTLGVLGQSEDISGYRKIGLAA